MTEAEIIEIGEGLADLSLPAERFNHAGHWAAVICLLHQFGREEVSRMMPAMIRRFNEAKGGVNSDTEGYHETITQASIAAAADRMGETMEESFAAVARSELMKSDWLLRHWRKETLFSFKARREWVAPDLTLESAVDDKTTNQ